MNLSDNMINNAKIPIMQELLEQQKHYTLAEIEELCILASDGGEDELNKLFLALSPRRAKTAITVINEFAKENPDALTFVSNYMDDFIQDNLIRLFESIKSNCSNAKSLLVGCSRKDRIKKSLFAEFDRWERRKAYSLNDNLIDREINVFSQEDNGTIRSVALSLLSENLNAALDSLNQRERKFIKEYFGIGYDKNTLESIAAEHCLSKERVRQIIKDGLEKLRRSEKENYFLGDFYDFLCNPENPVTEAYKEKSQVQSDKAKFQHVVDNKSTEVTYRECEWAKEEDIILRKLYPSIGHYVTKYLENRTESECEKRAKELKLPFNSKWTCQEIDILIQNYPVVGHKITSLLPKKTLYDCKKMADTVGLKNLYPSSRKWSKEEDSILRHFYPFEMGNVYARLFNRTKSDCNKRAAELHIKIRDYIICHDDEMWTPEEEDIIKQYYPTEGDSIYCRFDGHSKLACKVKARNMGISPPKSNRWTEEEDDVLRNYFPKEGADVFKRLFGRTAAACVGRANKIGVSYLGEGNAWTEEEENILRLYYPEEGVNVTKRLPGRTVSACVSRASKLKIKIEKSRKANTDRAIHTDLYVFQVDTASQISGKTQTMNPNEAISVKAEVKMEPAKKQEQSQSSRNRQWTEEEDNIIREYFKSEKGEVRKRLEKRTWGDCLRRAIFLGVVKDENNESRDHQSNNKRQSFRKENPSVWTKKEDSVLRKYFPTEGGCGVASRLPNKTRGECSSRAKELHITYNPKSCFLNQQ